MYNKTTYICQLPTKIQSKLKQTIISKVSNYDDTISDCRLSDLSQILTFDEINNIIYLANKANIKRKIKGYMHFDAYDICDITGQYIKVYRVYKNNKYIGKAVFQ